MTSDRPDGAPRALLLCATDIHVEMFAPVAAELRGRGWVAELVSLDRYYRQAASARAGSLGVEFTELPGEASSGDRSFYERSFLAVWSDVLRARRPVRSFMTEKRPSLLAVGNDYGLLEKLVLYEAKRAGLATLLVQEGLLGRRSRPRAIGIRGRLVRAGRRALSPTIRALGFTYLAASNYGQSGVDLICANGPAGVDYFRSLGVDEDRIVTTGQPRYDHIARLGPTLPDGGQRSKIVYFSTPFRIQNLGGEPQARQDRVIQELADAIADREGLRLTLKQHPRESRQSTSERLDVSTGRAHELLSDTSIAILGISSVLEEAALLRVPVIVPGEIVHGGRFEPFLPPSSAYPRFESVDEALRLIRGLGEPRRRAQVMSAQLAHLRECLTLVHGRTAASLVADAVVRVAHAE